MDNLRAATGWAFDAPALDDVALGVRVLEGLVGEMWSRPSWGIQAWAGAALRRVEELDARQRRVVFTAAAYDAFNTGQPDRANTLARSAIAESETFTPALRVALFVVIFSNLAVGDLAGAAAVLAESRRRLANDEASDWVVGQHHIAFFLAEYVGDRDTARSEAHQGLVSARRVGSPSLLASALSHHARMVSDENPEEALAAVDESIRLIQAGGGDVAYGEALLLAAILRSARGDTAGAARAVRLAVEHDADLGSRSLLPTDVAVAALVLAGHPDGVDAAATLAGALNGPGLGALPVLLGASDRASYERALANAAAALGPDAYTNAQQQGTAMTYDEIVTFTLGQLAGLANRSLEPATAEDVADAGRQGA